MLDRDVRVGRRLRSVELTSSHVRQLRVVSRKISWRAQTKTFNRISRTLTSIISKSNSYLAASDWQILSQTGLNRRINLKAAKRVLNKEYKTTFKKYQDLKKRFLEQENNDLRRRLEAVEHPH